jgi:hypothetical protein
VYLVVYAGVSSAAAQLQIRSRHIRCEFDLPRRDTGDELFVCLGAVSVWAKN